jgi:hypothetical protein
MRSAIGVLAALAAVALGGAGSAPPPGVAVFVQQVTERCVATGGRPSTDARFLQKTDINGDKLADWVLDEAALTCAGGPPVDRTAPSQVMIFAGDQTGNAQPVFQQGAYGVRLEKGAVWLAVRGPQCGRGVDPAQFCDRPLVWNRKAARPEFAPLTQARTPSRIRS